MASQIWSTILACRFYILLLIDEKINSTLENLKYEKFLPLLSSWGGSSATTAAMTITADRTHIEIKGLRFILLIIITKLEMDESKVQGKPYI